MRIQSVPIEHIICQTVNEAEGATVHLTAVADHQRQGGLIEPLEITGTLCRYERDGGACNVLSIDPLDLEDQVIPPPEGGVLAYPVDVDNPIGLAVKDLTIAASQMLRQIR